MLVGGKEGQESLNVARTIRVLILAWLVVPLLVLSAAAQDTGPEFVDPYPLSKADTSSPRATLRSFLDNANEAIALGQAGQSRDVYFRSLLRAIETLDFTATPHGNSYTVRGQRFRLLKEILDRLDLPPDDEIPGAEEAAASGLTEWTVPNTAITIRKVENGLREGEFLFSADTVERLERLYNRIQHLPYTTDLGVGIQAQFERDTESSDFIDRQVQEQLKPADTSSPRSTLVAFLDGVTRAHALAVEANEALAADPPTMTKREALEAQNQAHQQMELARATLDLSQVPEALRGNVGTETVLQLKEIIDRMLLPPEGSVPDALAVAAARSGPTGAFYMSTGGLRWRYPNTPIEIIEITEG